MSDNWYGAENWYAPLEDQGSAGEKDNKNKKPPVWRFVGLVALVAALIVATSLAFAGKGKESPSLTGTEDGELPENFTDFFSSYYTSTQEETPEINIPPLETKADFRIAEPESAGEELSLQEIYRKCSVSIVAIAGYAENSTGYSWGTGVVLSEDGLILTNTHVIEGCDSASVKLYDDSSYEAKLIGADSISDLAVLKIEAAGLIPAEFGDSTALSVGDRVTAIGNPLGEDFRMTMTDGIVSAIERGVSFKGHSMTLLQTNTALNEGNSGGALFNMYGQVVGITNMKMMSSYSSIEGIGFAIPSATVRTVVNSLVEYGEVKGRPSIGLTAGSIPPNAAEHYELPEGLYVSDVQAGSDAEAKGIMAGDIITAVNGQSVTDTADIIRIRNSLSVGDTMTLTIWRFGESFDVEIVLMETNDIY